MDKRKIKNNIIKKCYEKSLELLIKNSSAFGFAASSSNKKSIKRKYDNIFGRDASICALGALASKNKKLIETAKKGLLNLGKFQAENGQIPYFVDIQNKKSDFWYLGNIDSTLWWLLAVFYYDKYSGDKIKLKNKLSKNINLAKIWLLSQEHPRFFLLTQNEASDWADIMPRSGFVLYTNALWYWVKNIYEINGVRETKENFNYIFYPWQKIPVSYFIENHRAKRLINYIKKRGKENEYFLSYVNFSFWGEDVDIYGNILACFTGVADKKRAAKIIKYFINKKISSPFPVEAVLNPITKNSKSWRTYMENYNLNLPYQYHNGGCWPYIGGFWVLALKNLKESKLAEGELLKLAQANKINNWQFNEWLHGKTGKPMGMAGQSWNAAMFLLAFQNNFKF